MKKIALALASVGGLGFSPFASGTVGSLAGIPIFYCLAGRPIALLLCALALFFLGVWVSNIVIESLGDKDPSVVVLDEVVGYVVACAFFEWSWTAAAALFVLFRLFDVLKTYPINKLEQLPRGWGVMSDDVLAGVYAAFVFMLIKALM